MYSAGFPLLVERQGAGAECFRFSRVPWTNIGFPLYSFREARFLTLGKAGEAGEFGGHQSNPSMSQISTKFHLNLVTCD